MCHLSSCGDLFLFPKWDYNMKILQLLHGVAVLSAHRALCLDRKKLNFFPKWDYFLETCTSSQKCLDLFNFIFHLRNLLINVPPCVK